MNQSKPSKRPSTSSDNVESLSKLQKTNVVAKKKRDEALDAQIKAAVIAAALKGPLSAKKASAGSKKAEPTSKPAAKATPGSKSPVTSRKDLSVTKPSSKVPPSSASSKATPTPNEVPGAKTQTESKPDSAKSLESKTFPSKTESKPRYDSFKPRGRAAASWTKTVYAPTEQYPEINFYRKTSPQMSKLIRSTVCHLALREEGPKVFIVITADTENEKPVELQIKEAEEAIEKVWGKEACEKIIEEDLSHEGRGVQRYTSRKTSQDGLRKPSRGRENEPSMNAFTLPAHMYVDKLNSTTNQDFKPPASFEDDHMKKKLKELPTKEPRWNDFKLWDKVDLVVQLLGCKPPIVTFGEKLRRGGDPLWACKINWEGFTWLGVADSMEKSRINAYLVMYRTVERVMLDEIPADSFRKPFEDESFRKPFKDDSFKKPFRKPFQEDSFRKPLKQSFNKEWNEAPKNRQEEELERLLDCVEQVRSDLNEAKELQSKTRMQRNRFGSRFKGESDDAITARIERLQKEEENLKVKLERALNSDNETTRTSNDFSSNNPFQERTRKVFQSDKMPAKSGFDSSRNFQQKSNRNDGRQFNKDEESISKNMDWTEKRQQSDWEMNKERQKRYNEDFPSRNIPVWNHEIGTDFSQQDQQQTFQKPNRGRDFQMRGDRAGGRGRERYEGQRYKWGGNDQINKDFDSQGKKWKYDSPQTEKAFDNSKNEMGYGGPKSRWSYESQMTEKGFDNQKKELEFEEQSNKRSYVSQKDDAGFDVQKNITGYVSQKNVGYFSHKNFEGYSNQKSGQRDESQKDGRRFERGYGGQKDENQKDERWFEKGYQSRDVGNRIWKNERDSQGFGSGEQQEYRTRQEDNQDRRNYGRGTDSNSEIVRRSRSPIAPRSRSPVTSRNVQTWQSNPSPFVSTQESTGRFRTSVVKRDESKEMLPRANQSWEQHPREPSIEIVSSNPMQESKPYKSCLKTKSVDPRLETYGNITNSMHQTELRNLKMQVNEQLEEIKDCLREGTMLVEEQKQEVMRMAHEEERRNMYMKLSNLEESVNDLRSKEQQTLNKFQDKVKQLEMKYQGYSTVAHEPRGYFTTSYQNSQSSSSSSQSGSRYSTVSGEKSESFQRNMGEKQQQSDSSYAPFGNRSYQSFDPLYTGGSTSFTGGGSAYYTSPSTVNQTFDNSKFQSSSAWNQHDTSYGMKSSGTAQSNTRPDGSEFQQNKPAFENPQYQYHSTSVSDTQSMQGMEFNSKSGFSQQSFSSSTQRALPCEQYQSGSSRPNWWSSDESSSNPSSGNSLPTKNYSTTANRGYFTQSTQHTGNLQKW